MSGDYKLEVKLVNKINDGIVIDHIRAGQGVRIFNWLRLDKAQYTVALVINAHSEIMGKKDIIKIANDISVDFTALGLIDPNITVNIIKSQTIVEKIKLKLPVRVENILVCKNPRCITSTEKYVAHVFHLEDTGLQTYRCEYCDDIRTAGDFRDS
ncbi:MAG: aspartate carbamoyltransferase regulatory subunit [Treponema sp.]|nr:aspartate carbamoyltransferase regulatory subunit [Treponema sp.]